MLNVAAAFGGGVFLKQQFDQVQLPSFRRARDTAANFKLSVRVIACSAPALKEPGGWSRQRPRLEVTLGDAQKDTELADYAGGPSSPTAGACARECPWRFGDSLTFVTTLKDVQGPGLRLRLRAHSDVSLGPLQLQFARVEDLGEAAVDLRRRALPACVRDPKTTATGVDSWESPLLLIPLLHVRGGIICADHDLGQPTAHVALVISVNEDPEGILEACGDTVPKHVDRRPVGDVFASRADQVMRWLDTPVDLSGMPGSGYDSQADYIPGSSISDLTADMDLSAMQRWVAGAASAVQSPAQGQGSAFATLTPHEVNEAATRAKQRSAAKCTAGDDPLSTLQGPELEPEGWVSRKGPQGRVYWHHRALGPAPWESEANWTGCGGAVSSSSGLGVGAPMPPLESQFTPGSVMTEYGNHGSVTTEYPTMVSSASAPGSAALGSSVSASRSGLPPRNARASFGPITSPELPPECWVSHQGKDGRTFWHNSALGPAPWQRQDRAACQDEAYREESRVAETSNVDEIPASNLSSYSRDLAKTLCRGSDIVRRDVIGFFDEQLRSSNLEKPVKSNFAPFEFKIGNSVERIVVDITLHRRGDIVEVSHSSRCSTVSAV